MNPLKSFGACAVAGAFLASCGPASSGADAGAVGGGSGGGL